MQSRIPEAIRQRLTQVRANRPEGHSPYGGSVAQRILDCPYSLRDLDSIPKITSGGAAASEGSFAHGVLEDRLELGFFTSIDPEIVQSLEPVIEHIEGILAKYPDAFLLVEETFRAPEIHKECWGTADVVIVIPSTKTLIVGDLKYGKGIRVDPEENAQALLYAFSAARRLGLIPDTDGGEERTIEIDRVVLKIYQPRIDHEDGPIRSWETTPDRLVDFAFEYRKAICSSALVDIQPNPGEKQCRFCPKAPACEGNRARLNQMAEHVFADKKKIPVPAALGDTFTPESLAAMLDQLPAAKAFISNLEEFAYHCLQNGIEVPGYKLVRKRSNRSWSNEVKSGQAPVPLTKAFGIPASQVVESKIKSPAQIEKIVGKKVFAEAVQKHRLLDTTPAGTSMAPASDKRPAVTVESVEDVFKAK